jgi:small subunit ribosomal protein S1
VQVLSVDRDTQKIARSLKRAMPDPWTTVEERYHVGQVVPATITKLAKFGAFAKVEDGLEGLIHLSELTDLAVQDPAQVVQEGQRVNVKIIHINTARRRLGLSVRQAANTAVGSVQSFGGDDGSYPFADSDFGSFLAQDASDLDVNPVDETDEVQGLNADAGATETSTEVSPTADEQLSSAVQLEPVDSHTEDEPVAVADVEASPASSEVSSTDDGDAQPEVVSGARQGSVSE